MDGTSLVRTRWRLRGAWMWPSFVVFSLLDGLIVAKLPPLGDSGSFVAGWLIGMFANLICLIVLGPTLGFLLRRSRQDMPRTVARDYAGTATTMFVTLVLLVAGVVHHHVITADRAALHDATERAEAYIGDHAPARFQAHLHSFDVYEVQPPLIYRICDTVVPTSAKSSAPDTYCVVVHRNLPFAQSVSYAGSEANTLLSQGTN